MSRCKKIIMIIACIVLFGNIPVYAFQGLENNISDKLSEESVSFLRKYNINIEKIINEKNDYMMAISKNLDYTNKYDGLDESIKLLRQETEVYNFNNKQLKSYVEGLINTDTNYIYDRSIVKTPYSVNRQYDNGIGYEVKSEVGYYQQTAFATVPTVKRNGVNGSSAYMFYTFADSNESYGIDVGIWYGYGYDGYGWRGFYTADGVQKAPNGVIKSLKAGSKVYLQAYITDNMYVRWRVLDANDFSRVLFDCSYYVGGKITKTNNKIIRQITLCNDNADFNTGEYLKNAGFSQAYLYSESDGHAIVSNRNTVESHCGAFGTNNTNREYVKVNSYKSWHEEDVSIIFEN